MRKFHLNINGKICDVNASDGQRLSEVLREQVGLWGTKVGCDTGDCGACTVLLDGEPVCACLTPLAQVQEQTVETVEGLAGGDLSDLQRAFLRHGAAQCGICSPGMLMAAEALLRRQAKPSRQTVEEALSGVLCRCTGYAKIVDAVLDVAGQSAEKAGGVGARMMRVDGEAKVLGTEVFGADNAPAEALWLRAVRSPLSCATFEFGDLKAWAHPRGVQVFIAEDVPGVNRFGVLPEYADQPVLAAESIRMKGEAVAIIAGPRDVVSSLDLKSFPVSWTECTPVLDPVEAEMAGKPLIHQTRPGNALVAGHVRCGDAEAAMQSAAHVVRGALSTSHVEHAYIEPEAGVAWMDGDVLVVRVSTQTPMMDRDALAEILNVPKSRVWIVPAATGGGFGGKLDLSVQPFLGLVSLITG
ncbi:MAG: molybdopterin-dependent oxidoreductase, partial [Shimia sp.]|nr:molybdopterin-dependent oxidoreductase [Shimia sp.]